MTLTAGTRLREVHARSNRSGFSPRMASQINNERK
jgi:hypothetical protein